ncbi:hypothetical protein Aduo_008083 [Ancylostoma duodenale]
MMGRTDPWAQLLKIHEHFLLLRITSIHGCLIINGTRIKSAALQQLKEVTPNKDLCEYTYPLLIYGNPLLTEIKFGKRFRPSPTDIFIRSNPQLRLTGINGAQFKVDIGSSADCLLKEAESNTNCTNVVGDVGFNNLSSDAWNRIKEVHGTVHVESTSITNLNDLKNLRIVGWKKPALVISKNEKLVDISALLTMTIEPKSQPIEIKDNPNICHTTAEKEKLEKWLSMRKSSVQFSKKCLKACPGGKVTSSYLASFDKRCDVIEGTLDISGLKELPQDIDRLEQVEKIKGRLLVRNNEAIKDMSFLKNLMEIQNPDPNKYAHTLVIYGNPHLKKIEFDKKFSLEQSETFIRSNPKSFIAGIKRSKSQVDVDCLAKEAGTIDNCTRLVGDVKYEEISPEIWQRVETVEGTIYIENTDMENLDAINNLTIIGLSTPALVISNNKKLVDISALMSIDIRSKEPAIEFKDNPLVCHNIVERKTLKEWMAKKGISVKFSGHCLKSCPGGAVTSEYLANLDKRCNTIEGDLVIDKIKDLPANINKLEQVEKIHGRLLVTNNEAVQDVRFLRNLREIDNPKPGKPGLVIENNKNLKNRTLESLGKVVDTDTTENFHHGTTTKGPHKNDKRWRPTDSHVVDGELRREPDFEKDVHGSTTVATKEDNHYILIFLAAFIVFLIAVVAAIGIAVITVRKRKARASAKSRQNMKGTPTARSKNRTPTNQSGQKGTPSLKSNTPSPAKQSGRLLKGTAILKHKTKPSAKRDGRLQNGTPSPKSKTPSSAKQSGRLQKGTPSPKSKTPSSAKLSGRLKKAISKFKNKKPKPGGQPR